MTDPATAPDPAPDPDPADAELPMPEPTQGRPAAEHSGSRVVRGLYRARRLLLAFYLMVWVPFLVVFVAGLKAGLPEWDLAFSSDALEDPLARGLIALVMVGLQVVLIGGLGSVRVERGTRPSRLKLLASGLTVAAATAVVGVYLGRAAATSSSWWSNAMIEPVFAGLATLMLVGGAAFGFRRLLRHEARQTAENSPAPARSVRTTRSVGQRVMAALALSVFSMVMAGLVVALLYAGADYQPELGGNLLAVALATVFLVLWIVWFVVGLRLLARGKQSRLVQLLYVGSWIEFAIALPLYLPQNRGCISVLGSWTALVISVPAILLTTGPALWLLFRHEATESFASPRAARRILLEKTRFHDPEETRRDEQTENWSENEKK